MTLTIVSPSPNGAKPGPAGPARVILLPALGEKVDHLAELRTLIRQAQETEREITAELLATMQATGLRRLEGRQAVAIRDERTTLKVDVGLFVEALGTRAHEALTVSMTVARRLMGADDLAAIAATTTTPALRVEPLTKDGAR